MGFPNTPFPPCGHLHPVIVGFPKGKLASAARLKREIQDPHPPCGTFLQGKAENTLIRPCGHLPPGKTVRTSCVQYPQEKAERPTSLYVKHQRRPSKLKRRSIVWKGLFSRRCSPAGRAPQLFSAPVCLPARRAQLRWPALSLALPRR